MDKEIIISLKTILLTFLILLGVYVLYRLGPIIGILVIATIIVVSVEPLVKFFMEKTFLNKPVTRSLAVILTYVLLIFFLVGVLTLGLPPVIGQVGKLIKVITGFLSDLNISGQFDSSLSEVYSQLANVSGGVLSATLSLFSNLASVISVLIISIYMSLDWKNLKERVFGFFPDNSRETAVDTVNDIEISIGQWVKGQLILMVTIGVVSFLGLLVLGVDYPLALGLIAGLLEIVPVLGPILTAIIASIVGFAADPLKGVGVIVLFTIIQQLENNFLVPKIMGKVSGFSPLIILLALLVGSEFFGILGAVLAVPLTMIGTAVLRRVLVSEK
jgi:predicted PurR-regulated permease PerM